MDFAAKITSLLTLRGMSQADLSRETGIAQTAISQMRSGNQRPYMDQALKISKALNVSLDYLADDSVDEPPRGSELSDDEKYILRFYRDVREPWNLDAGRAIGGLIMAMLSGGRGELSADTSPIPPWFIKHMLINFSQASGYDAQMQESLTRGFEERLTMLKENEELRKAVLSDRLAKVEEIVAGDDEVASDALHRRAMDLARSKAVEEEPKGPPPGFRPPPLPRKRAITPKGEGKPPKR